MFPVVDSVHAIYSNFGMGMQIVIAERVECGEDSPL